MVASEIRSSELDCDPPDRGRNRTLAEASAGKDESGKRMGPIRQYFTAYCPRDPEDHGPVFHLPPSELRIPNSELRFHGA